MVWGIFSWHTLGPLVLIEHRLHTVYLSIVADHVHPFMTTVYHLLMTNFQQDNAPSKAQIISDWFLNMRVCFSNELHSHRSQSNRAALGCGGTEIHIMDGRQICSNCVMLSSIWTKISEECFQHLVESMQRRIKAKEKGSNPVLEGVPNKVARSVYISNCLDEVKYPQM